MDFQSVEVTVADGIGTLTLNRPDRMNAFDDVMRKELVEATGRLVNDDSVRAIVVTGSGKAFCAGADVKYMAGALREKDWDGAMGLVNSGAEVVTLLRETPKPVLGSLNGVAAGGGANLALACDLRIASDRAGIGQVFHRIGLHPDMGGTFFLPHLVGPARALELIWSAEVVPAERCLELGLVNRMVPHDQLAGETAAWAARLAALPPVAAGLVKMAVYQGMNGNLSDALAREGANQRKCFTSEDAVEGLRAFSEKRTPIFQGR
ncbi:MAG: enoyl-CoA hydratase/isomerase family protein [Gemmatimonadales bacterium]